MNQDERRRRQHFEFLVLQGIWLIIKILTVNTKEYLFNQHRAVWRGEAINYFDTHGNQAEGSKQYRRKESFPE